MYFSTKKCYNRFATVLMGVKYWGGDKLTIVENLGSTKRSGADFRGKRENLSQVDKRLNAKREELKVLQEGFLIGIKNMYQRTYERNAINELMAMMRLKAEIEELTILSDAQHTARKTP